MGQIIEIIIFSIYMITYLFIDEGNFINIDDIYRSIRVYKKIYTKLLI